MAILHCMEKTPDLWETLDLDKILKDGDNLYEHIGLNKFLLISDLPQQCFNFDIKPLSSYCGTVDRKVTQCPFYSLSDAVKDIDKFCFMTFECYTIAIIKHTQYFYVFDPHSRNDCGMAVPDGKAVLVRHDSFKELCTFLMHLCATLFKISNKKVFFEVNHVSISPLKLFKESSTDIQHSSTCSEFSGFSELSEGEYSCKMYMLSERQKELERDLEEDTNEQLIDETLHALNDSITFIQSIDLDAFEPVGSDASSDESIDSMNVIETSTDEEIPLFHFKKIRIYAKKERAPKC